MGTVKQEKLLKLILENLGKTDSKPMGKLMLIAGYSEAQSKNPFQILESEFFKEKLDDWAKMLDDKRRMAITYITPAKLEKSSARDLSQVATTLTKDYQLATGGSTENIKEIYDWGEYDNQEESDNLHTEVVD